MTEPDSNETRQQCSACRGTGSVISNLGGSPQTIACPWCDGGAVYLPGHDAQARWREQEPALDV